MPIVVSQWLLKDGSLDDDPFVTSPAAGQAFGFSTHFLDQFKVSRHVKSETGEFQLLSGELTKERERIHKTIHELPRKADAPANDDKEKGFYTTFVVAVFVFRELTCQLGGARFPDTK